MIQPVLERDPNTGEDLCQAVFLSAKNGFVGPAELFLRNPWLTNREPLGRPSVQWIGLD
jgi:hypothetical protein